MGQQNAVSVFEAHSYGAVALFGVLSKVQGLNDIPLAQLLEGSGVEPGDILSGSKISPRIRQISQVFANALDLSCLPHVGLEAGTLIDVSILGPLGQLALLGPDLLSVVKPPADLSPLRLSFIDAEVSFVADKLQCVTVLEPVERSDVRRMMMEMSAMLIQKQMEEALGDVLQNALFVFDYPRPEYGDLYEDYLHGTVKFDGGTNAIVLPADMAHLPNKLSNPAAWRANESLCRAIIEDKSNAPILISDQVKMCLLSKPMGSFSEIEVAASLCVSRRTLMRKLDREGTSFRKVKIALLQDLAIRYLKERDLSIEAIAELLGYYDTAGFRRAFRRWFQVSPSAYRESLPVPTY